MEKRGHLHCKYILEENTELLQKTSITLQKDATA
jgi:hypothetical protein